MRLSGIGGADSVECFGADQLRPDEPECTDREHDSSDIDVKSLSFKPHCIAHHNREPGRRTEQFPPDLDGAHDDHEFADIDHDAEYVSLVECFSAVAELVVVPGGIEQSHRIEQRDWNWDGHRIDVDAHSQAAVNGTDFDCVGANRQLVDDEHSQLDALLASVTWRATVCPSL
jgi:hypothetical protein